MRPQRVQLRRTRGWRMPANTRKVDRTTPWGNPFSLSEGRATCVALFEDWVRNTAEGRALLARARTELRAWNLACWCALEGPCHAEVWLRLVND